MNEKEIEYYFFQYAIPIYKIKPPKTFCDYFQTHKDEIIIELDKKNKRLNNIINELENYIRARVDDDNTCSICSVMIDDLLNILEGSDKE